MTYLHHEDLLTENPLKMLILFTHLFISMEEGFLTRLF